MSKYKTKNFKASLNNALRGILILWKSEKNFRTHIMFAVFVLFAAIFIGFDTEDFILLLLTISMVILCEMFNSVIEFSLDALFKNKFSKLVGMAKDIAAGAVTLSAFVSVIIGILLFWHNIFD